MKDIFFVLSADENLLFRGNSFATKAMDYYMKMVGEEVSFFATSIQQSGLYIM